MDIFEDDIYLPDDNKNEALPFLPEDGDSIDDISLLKADGESKKKNQDSGMRIIFQAPEKSGKREFTGFRDEADEKPTAKNEYKGGYAYEEEMRRNKNFPQKTAYSQSVKAERKLSYEEEKKRRYIESIKAEENARREREQARREREEEIKKEEERRKNDHIIEDDEMVEINTEEKSVRKKTVGDRIRHIVIVIAVIAMIGSIGVLIKQYVQVKQGEAWENEVTGLIIDVPDTTKKHPNKGDKDKNDNTEDTTERVLTIEEQWAQLRNDYPDVTFPEGLSLRYAKLYAVNQDFVGYLSINNIDLELPVVQSQKDTDTDYYYLRRSFYKKYSVYGCPFAQKQNNMKDLDRNTVIYGHTNNSNLAFAPLNKYKTLDGFKSAPVIKFDTLYDEYKWKIVAVMIVNTNPEDDNGYVFNYTFTQMQSDEEFARYIGFLKQRSLYDTGVDVLATDKILTLSTCTYDFDDARFIVVARLVRPGETEDVNTSIAKVNENPRFPQAYYDKKNKDNPYRDAENWYYSGS